MESKDNAVSWEMTLVGAGLVLFGYFAVNFALEGAIHNRRAQTVPDLKGRSLAAALEALSPLGLGLRKTGVENDAGVPIASILRQDPPAGTIVREGKTIRVVISQGGHTVQSPTIIGLPLRNAEMLLRQSQLSLGEVNESYSLKFEKGVVLSQDPKAETSVGRDTFVNVTVSGGAPPSNVALMPDFQRKTAEDVNAWAASAGKVVSIKQDPNSLFPAGTVLSQKPDPDAQISADTAVSVVVSGRKGDAAAVAGKTFRYDLAPGGADAVVRIVLFDKFGERELFNGLRKPGSKIEVPVQTAGGAHVKIYQNGTLVEERDL